MEHTKDTPALKERAAAMASELGASGPCSVIPIPAIISIITTMIQAIMQCFQPNPSPTPAKYVQQYVASFYDYHAKTYSKRLMRRMKYQAEKAGLAQTPPIELNEEQTTALAYKALEEARLGHSVAMAAIDETSPPSDSINDSE